MKVITFREDGEKVRLCDLEPGTLFEHNGCIALKSEYQTNRGLIEAAIVGSGEQFWGSAETIQEQRELLVQPFVLTEDEEAPTVDAVEVVRCKDCTEWGGVPFGNVCRRWSAPLAGMKNCTGPDDFCSYGERGSEHEA